jgi:hypothetical protein
MDARRTDNRENPSGGLEMGVKKDQIFLTLGLKLAWFW